MWRKKKVCPFFLLENSRPLSPWEPLDSLSTCLGNDSVRLPFPSPEDLPDPGIEPRSPALQVDSFTV